MVKPYCERIFAVVFSVLAVALIYILISANGVILGNDPAVHLSKAYEMLETGKVSVSEITWYPPLYRVILAELITFTGAVSIGNAIFLVKVLTVTIDWLLIFSVYLLARRLLNAVTGMIASFLLFLCFPFYEINFWGGYPSLLSIVYLCLLILYLARKDGYANTLIIFIMAFSIVLTHPFTTFLTILLLIIYTAIVLFIFRDFTRRLLIIAIFGAVAAFILWYFPIMIPYLDVLIAHVFFSQKQYLYLVNRVNLDVFLLNFGYILFLAFFGAVLTVYECKKKKMLDFHILLFLSFLVPLLLTQSYLLGIMLPYDRFIYYLMPSAAAFASAIIYAILKFGTYITNSVNRKWIHYFLDGLKLVFTISIIVWLLASRYPVLTSKISEATGYYSYIDLQGCQAASWLKNGYSCKSSIVVTEKPGLFFGLFSDKKAFMETNPVVERAALAETVLSLAYEIENPVTLYRVYEGRMPYELDRFNVLEHNVWRRVSFMYDQESELSYVEDGENFSVRLSDLNRKINWIWENGSKKLQILYFVEGKFLLVERVEMRNGELPANISWALTPLGGSIKKMQVHLSIHLDLNFYFEKAYVPGILNWENPLDKPSYRDEREKWVLTFFTSENLTGKAIAVYSSVNRTFYAVKFAEFPDLGSLGALVNRQIDALRLTYDFENLNQTVSFSYSLINFSEESFQGLDLSKFEELFELKSNFEIQYRDYLTYIKEFEIRFLVFSKESFRSQLLNSRFLQLIYADDKHAICKVRVGS